MYAPCHRGVKRPGRLLAPESPCLLAFCMTGCMLSFQQYLASKLIPRELPHLHPSIRNGWALRLRPQFPQGCNLPSKIACSLSLPPFLLDLGRQEAHSWAPCRLFVHAPRRLSMRLARFSQRLHPGPSHPPRKSRPNSLQGSVVRPCSSSCCANGRQLGRCRRSWPLCFWAELPNSRLCRRGSFLR
jgi:hypothetical protein